MAIALVSGQVASVALGSANSGNVVLPNNPTTGNFVVVGVVLGSETASATVQDSAGNSYTATSSSPASANGLRAYIFYLVNAPANANKTITVTIGSGPTSTDVWAVEFSGLVTSSPVDVQGTKTSATTGTNINLPSITPTADGELLIGVGAALGTISVATSPWTMIDAARNGDGAEYYIQPTAGARAIGFTQSPSSGWTAIAAAFKAAAAAASSAPPLTPTSFLPYLVR